MPNTNPFFSTTTGYTGEVNLLDDLTREQIKIYGIDIIYMPRKLVNLDLILHESSKSAFEMGFPIPMYIKTFDGFDNGNELLTKFGIRSADQLTFQMSRTEFTTYYAPFLKSYYEAINDGGALDALKGQTAARPKEGDLLYFPFDDSIFEIKYVQFDVPFFQFGHGYIFELECEKFEYSGETFDTGYSDIDDTSSSAPFYKTSFDCVAGGTGTFSQFETVTIYNVADTATPTTTVPDPADPFSLYNDSGFLEDVQTLTAKVVSWDKTNLQLVVENISNNDPEQEDSVTLDVDVSKLSDVLIVGSTSGASYLTTESGSLQQAFDDSDSIQTEFDTIKVIDVADENPFGFV